ncbi:hypothetical protein MSG28_015253 [Choristoneura fumiferana]|uniref:Uncharacterized protein n=1 Tax=Choristoneura fumiferana TaxID=7141 RepID=A0ACC0KYV4_CHOFU|nr:hypothetical protein MSG28_015253 [Choristoneura fumiferana]
MESNGLLDDKDGPDVQVTFPESVASRIEELMGGTEQFDSEEARKQTPFDAVSYINRVFPTEQSLAGVESAAARCALRLAGAGRSESMVREITAEIKQLDRAKTNLTAAITALNHYHMLCGAAAALRGLAAQRQYGALLPPLQAVMQVLQHFERYRDIRSLNALRDDVTALRHSLGAQIMNDFKEAFTAGKSSTVSARTLAEACPVVDALEPKEYEHLFSAEQEMAWLPHVERRYAWLKRHLLAFEEGVGSVLPRAWHLSRRIATHFCQITRRQLSEQLTARRGELDVKLLLYAIQKTGAFEQLLHQRFQIDSGTHTDQPSEPTEGSTDSKNVFDANEKDFHCWHRAARRRRRRLGRGGGGRAVGGLIGGCFEPYLSLCADLFLFYKKCLVQCAALSTGEPMLELAGVFQKYLREYASGVLQAAAPRAAAPLGLALVHNLQLHASGTTRYTKQEISKITSVITTAEYCLETTVHLEQKLKEKVAPALAARVDLAPEQDLFHQIIGDCIQLLVQDLESWCEPALVAMAKVSWLHFDTVGDQSSYVTQIIMHLKNTVPILRDNLSSSRKYFTQFCIRFANSFIPKFIQNIYKCKPISTVGSEQLLLDTHMLKTALLELPSLGSEVKRPAPATYTKVVIKLMTKAEMILKLVMAPLDGSAEAFVAQFVQLLGDCSLAEFHKVLDMKGAKLSKAQLGSLDALFKQTAKNNSEANK